MIPEAVSLLKDITVTTEQGNLKELSNNQMLSVLILSVPANCSFN